PDRVAKNVDDLLDLENKIYVLSVTRLTNESLPNIVLDLGNFGIDQMILSARGSHLRDVTERELSRHNLSFSVAGTDTTTVRSYLPYKLDSLGESCLTQKDVSDLNLGEPKSVSFGHGIMMTDGQHKGAMLRTFICGRDRWPVIVFIDDRQKNVNDM